MRSLALFSPTFTKVQQMLQSIQRIKNGVFKETKKRVVLESCQRAFFVANAIQRNVSQIQSSIAQQQLSMTEKLLQSRNMTISYDYKRKSFILDPKQVYQNSHPKMSIKSSIIEQIDHPLKRNSLYFHELKNMEQYFQIQYPKNAPNFVKQMYRRNSQNMLLDLKNPLGLPINAPPLCFTINFKDRFLVDFTCKFGNINIKTVRVFKSDPNEEGGKKIRNVILGMNIPRNTQRIIFQYCKKQLLLEQPQLYRLHRLSYIGGRVEQIESLLNVYSFFTTYIDR